MVNHKKKVKGDKAKVKLKLVKGLNETKTDFKVHKIKLKEQLSATQDKVGRQKLDVKDVLNRLRHPSFRLDTLRGLNELNINSESTGLHLYELLLGVSAICLDIRTEARHESFKVLSKILSALSTDKIGPFFHVILSYLCCAMTHIQSSIQEDSLLMLDVLLKSVPKYVAANSKNILKNCIDMISKIRTDDKHKRTLVINMSNKTTSVKWRIKVLDHLRGLLKSLVDHNKWKLAYINGPNQHKVTKTFNASQPQYFSVICSSLNISSDIYQIFNTPVAHNSDYFTCSESTSFQGYIEILMPLLFDSWLEVRPNIFNKDTTEINLDVILSNDALFTLKIVVEILQNLWLLIEVQEIEIGNNDLSCWFRNKYANNFVMNFIGGFPYQHEKELERIKLKTKKKAIKLDKTTTSEQYCIQQNIILSYLILVFYNHEIHSELYEIKEILKFLINIVSEMGNIDIENWVSLERALRAALIDNGPRLLSIDESNTRLLLRSVISSLLNCYFDQDGAAKIIVLLCDIIKEPGLYKLYSQNEFENLLMYLPQLLLKPAIPEYILLTFKSLVKQKNQTFLKSLRSLIGAVIENVQSIRVVGSENVFEGKKHIMNLFFWIDGYTQEKRDVLVKKIELNIMDKRIIDYFKFILNSL